jgi:transposase
MYWKRASRGNSSSFTQFLHQLMANFKGKKIGIVVDNSSIHKSKKIKAFTQKYREKIKLYFLPTYSPEFNPIERMWGWIKKHLYGACEYVTSGELCNKLRKLIWHYHEGSLATSINFSFPSYQIIYNQL